MKQKKLTGIPKNIPKNKVNQKELSQIKNSEQKVLENQKTKIIKVEVI